MKRLKTKSIVMLLVVVLSFVIVPVALAWPFPDVPPGYWAYEQIRRIAAIHITSGCGGGNFCPENNVTRAQMAVFMDNFSKAWTTNNEPFIYSVDNKNNGATFSGDGIVAKSYDQNGIEGITYGGTWSDYGVYGESNGTGTADYAVYGYSTGTSNSPAIAGYAAGPDSGASYGIYGLSANSHAIYGDSNSTSSTYYGGWFKGPQGVRAENEVASTDAISVECTAGGWCWGVDSYSYTTDGGGYAIHAATSDTSHNYGLNTPDNIYSLNYHAASGFSMIAVNGSDQPLEVGDAVAVIGMGVPLPEADVPVMLVQKADATNATSIVGVVTTAYQITIGTRYSANYKDTTFADPEGKGNPSSTYAMPEMVAEQAVIQVAIDGPVAPGGYMVIMIQGIALVNVDVGAGIQAGDLLTIGPNGTAVRAQAVTVTADGLSTYQAGTILGKALEPLLEGMNQIWVMVDLR